MICILLAVKKVHDGLEDVVSILCYAAASTCWHISRSLHLAKYIAHLLDIFFNVWLETSRKMRWTTDVSMKTISPKPLLPNPLVPHLVANILARSSKTLLSFT